MHLVTPQVLLQDIFDVNAPQRSIIRLDRITSCCYDICTNMCHLAVLIDTNAWPFCPNCLFVVVEALLSAQAAEDLDYSQFEASDPFVTMVTKYAGEVRKEPPGA